MKELDDNFVGDQHTYVISVETGCRINAGTTAHVSFVLSGVQGDTGVRHLSASDKRVRITPLPLFS